MEIAALQYSLMVQLFLQTYVPIYLYTSSGFTPNANCPSSIPKISYMLLLLLFSKSLLLLPKSMDVVCCRVSFSCSTLTARNSCRIRIPIVREFILEFILANTWIWLYSFWELCRPTGSGGCSEYWCCGGTVKPYNMGTCCDSIVAHMAKMIGLMFRAIICNKYMCDSNGLVVYAVSSVPVSRFNVWHDDDGTIKFTKILHLQLSNSIIVELVKSIISGSVFNFGGFCHLSGKRMVNVNDNNRCNNNNNNNNKYRYYR